MRSKNTNAVMMSASGVGVAVASLPERRIASRVVREPEASDIASMVAYVLSNIPIDHVDAFRSGLAKHDVGSDDYMELLKNWVATAEIHASPEAVATLLDYIEFDEASRAERLEQEEWDWQAERDRLFPSK